VGGTDFSTKSTVGDEKAWTDGGGGFSDHFDIPDWQADLVAAYKADPEASLPPQHMWNNTGRGYPDVAALGGEVNPYCVVVDGITQGVAGTSASSPVTASIFARLNGIRLAAGKPPLGFLNPFIYKNAQAFNDVTEGKNSGGGIGAYGFKAIKGWDPATGMGTPNYGLLAEAVAALP
jgi:tripeptidyl-peptidase-1